MAKLKTFATKLSVKNYLDSIKDPVRKKDCIEIAKMMEAATKEKPIMWGTAIVGYGKRMFHYSTGREVEWMIIGFSSRKQALTLYLGLDIKEEGLLDKLGKHSKGKGCLYIKSLNDVNKAMLKALIKKSVKRMREYK